MALVQFLDPESDCAESIESTEQLIKIKKPYLYNETDNISSQAIL